MTNRETLENILIRIQRRIYDQMSDEELARWIAQDSEFLCQYCPVQHLCSSKPFEDKYCESVLLLFIKTTGIF